jgi:hypothetical protein
VDVIAENETWREALDVFEVVEREGCNVGGIRVG